MKKIFGIYLMAVMTVIFAACNDSKPKAPIAEQNESEASVNVGPTDTLGVDNSAIDTLGIDDEEVVTRGAAQSPTKWFKKTNNRCRASSCSCSGYWGIYHENGSYEGACSNTDGYGHRCGHGPEKHGLKRW